MKKSKLLFFLLMVLFGLVLISCGEEPTPTPGPVDPEPVVDPEPIDDPEPIVDPEPIEEFTITFELDGGEIIGTYEAKYVKGEEYILPTCKKEGYIFLGWVLSDGTVIEKIGKDSSGDIKVTATWEKEPELTHAITYVLNGGALPDDAKFEYTEGETYVLPIPTQESFTFLGWSLSEDSTQYIEVIDSTWASDVTVYANWKSNIIVYNIEYVLNGGTLLEEAITEYVLGDAFELPKISKNGYKFLGWTLAEGSKQYVTEITETTQGDFVFYAEFKEIVDGEYNISYVYEDGRLITHTAANIDEFLTQFWKEFYEWSGSKSTLDEFRVSQMNSWKSGSTGSYKLYKEGGKDDVDDSYFINKKGNDAWRSWMDVFSAQVTAINSSQTAWGSNYVGYIRLYEFLGQTGKSYWSSSRIEAAYKAYPIPEELIYVYNTKEASKPLRNLCVDDGRTFLGWTLEDGTKVTSTGELKGDVTLYANWSSSTPVTSFEVTNKVSEMYRFDTLQLEWVFNPTDCTNKKVKFVTSDKNVISVTEDGFLTALKNGTATVTVVCCDNSKFNIIMNIVVKTDPFIDIDFASTNALLVGEKTKITAKLYGTTGNIKYTVKDPSVAKIENGEIVALAKGYTQITAYLEGNDKVSLTFGVTVNEKDSIFETISKGHNEEAYIRRELPVGSSYKTDVYCSVSDLLFNFKYDVNTAYEENQRNVSSNHGGTRTSTEFICVHYTAGFAAGSTAEANASYFSRGGADTSIHYTTGNDGIFHILDDSLVGFHAGDGTGVKFEWIYTGVKADKNEKPVWGVVKNSASSTGYYFTLNGKATTIAVPVNGTSSSGAAKTLSDPSKAFTYFGPAWKVQDGYYYMGTTWVCFTQVASGAISSRGGNLNSVGIETACNKGSDLWLTYQYTAELVARLMDKFNLDITRVVGHNAFSGKNCPQTLLNNNGELWEKFMECVQAEYDLYEALTKSGNYTITAKSSNTDLVSDNGRVVKIPNYTTAIEYTVTIKNNSTGEEFTQTYSTILHGAYTE